MSVTHNEEAYARGLRASARETLARMSQLEMVEETRDHGALRAAVLGALSDAPATASGIATVIRKGCVNITCTLRRLEADGLALRAGSVAGRFGRKAVLWVRGPGR